MSKAPRTKPIDEFRAFVQRNIDTLELDENEYIGRLRSAGVFRNVADELRERVGFRHFARLIKEGVFDKRSQPPRARAPRKPSLARALREAKKAGVNVAAATVTGQGVALTFGERAAGTNQQDEVETGYRNMRINAKGLHWTLVKLADGTRKIYYYAWRGGPRLVGDYGSPEFIASYNAAVATRVTAPEGRLLSLLQGYQQSQDFLSLRERTRVDYVTQIKKIEHKFGDAPIKALADPRTRGIFLGWRDELALRSKRQADYAWTVLARVLSWAKDRGKIAVNPCARGGRVYHGTRVDFVWSVEDEAAFLEHAPQQLHLPLLLALWTGQRQGDLLRLPWSAYDGEIIRLRQSKTGARVVIPVAAPLKAALDATPRLGPIIVTSTIGRPWTPEGFRAQFSVACKKAGIAGLTFNDLRGTAVTRLALVGCTEAEIATITGHSLRDVHSILDAHYLHRDIELAKSAITKLEMGYAKRAAEGAA